VKSHEVYLTDFGTTLDWSDVGHSTTTGLAAKGTLRYCAPEVAQNLPRKSSADIWSLGCVFLEMWTTLCGYSTSELDSYMQLNGSKSRLYHANISGVTRWCHMLSSGSSDDARVPGPWVRSMLEVDASTRCSIQSLAEDIHALNFEYDTAVSFSGLCCSDGDDAAESVHCSDDETGSQDAIERRVSLEQSSTNELSSSGPTSFLLSAEETNQSPNHKRLKTDQLKTPSESALPKERNVPSGMFGRLTGGSAHQQVKAAHPSDQLQDKERSMPSGMFGRLTGGSAH
jgi:serine/threonine protein kinase